VHTEVSCAYEAGCCGYAAHRAFESYGWTSIVVNPADIARTNKSQYQKTDKIDAALICRELKDGRLNGITIPDKDREALRCLFRRRNDLVKDFRAICNFPLRVKKFYNLQNLVKAEKNELILTKTYNFIYLRSRESALHRIHC